MEIEQIIKRLEWLDDERRKDKNVITALEERVRAMEGGVPGLSQQVKQFSGELAHLTAMLGRMDQFEGSVTQVRVELTRMIDSNEKVRVDRDRELEKLRRAEMEGVNKGIADVRKGLEAIPDLKKGAQARVEEDYRLGRLIEEAEQKILELSHGDEEYKRTLRLVEEGRRQDNKRITDQQGEVSALRKRADEQRGKIDLTSDNLRKLESRLGELLAAEGERRQLQTAFVEKQTLMNVERDRLWKEMQARFETIEKQAVNVDAQLQTLESTHRSVKRSQESLDDVTQKIERRINEITEMQRLTEDRIRQDWVSFRADDQKRWTNYTLAQEELQREYSRQNEKMIDRLVFLEDISQELQDQLHQITEETEKRLQSLLALTRDWMEAYERSFGRSK